MELVNLDKQQCIWYHSLKLYPLPLYSMISQFGTHFILSSSSGDQELGNHIIFQTFIENDLSNLSRQFSSLRSVCTPKSFPHLFSLPSLSLLKSDAIRKSMIKLYVFWWWKKSNWHLQKLQMTFAIKIRSLSPLLVQVIGVSIFKWYKLLPCGKILTIVSL